MLSTNQSRTLAFGLLAIVVGFVLILHQLRILPPKVDDILISWQMLLIGIGIFNLISAQSRVFGYLLIAVGGFFLLPQLFELPYNFTRNFWPLILIVVGLIVIVKGFGRKEPAAMRTGENDGQFIDEFNVFSGSEKKISMKQFRGGRITSIFGGSEIDLTDAELSNETNVLELFYLFGGSTIHVPTDWIVVNNVHAIFGGFSDKRKVRIDSEQGQSQKTLILRGMVMFGGGEIKS